MTDDYNKVTFAIRLIISFYSSSIFDSDRCISFNFDVVYFLRCWFLFLLKPSLIFFILLFYFNTWFYSDTHGNWGSTSQSSPCIAYVNLFVNILFQSPVMPFLIFWCGYFSHFTFLFGTWLIISINFLKCQHQDQLFIVWLFSLPTCVFSHFPWCVLFCLFL